MIKRMLWVTFLVPTLALSQTGKGMVSGHIQRLQGGPAAGVRVAAMAVPNGNEPAVLETIASTDETGAFRLENITPGRYYIIAGFVDMPTYYPGTSVLANASIVTVTATTPVINIDFASSDLTTPVKVSGRVLGLENIVPGVRMISLMPSATAGRPLTRPQPPPVIPLLANGSFEFSEVRPGTYSVNLLGLTLPQPMTLIVVDRDITNLEVTAIDPEKITSRLGLEDVWSISGAFAAAAWDEKTGLLHASRGSGVAARRLEIDAAGKVLSEHPLPNSSSLRVVHRASGAPLFLSSATWSAAVKAFDADGTQVWSYPESGQGIDDVWPADLDGDGTDEVIVGFNGSTGLHVVNATGQPLWKSTSIGNVWHVAAGDVMGEGKPRVVTTSATGRVHVFDADGKSKRDLNPGFYANMVRAEGRMIVAIGGDATSGTLQAAGLSGDGTVKWSRKLDNVAITSPSAAIAPGKPWVAVSAQGGIVYVLNMETGAVIGRIDGQGSSPGVAWMKESEKDAPLLVVSTGSRLHAYRVSAK